MMAVPKEWMPPARMSRIHVHWTAGSHSANAVDRGSYHILVEGSGNLVRGDHSINANERPSTRPRASHTKNANTGAIGVSMCCMHDAKERPFDAGPSPMTRTQWDKMITVVADLARAYGILVTPQTILTHAEVQPTLNIPQEDKWDIVRLPFDPAVQGHRAVGDRMRKEIATVLERADPHPGPLTPPADMKLPRLRVAGVKPLTLNFRDAPNGAKKGALPEGVIVERIAMSQNWSQVRTPGGFVGWVSSSFLVPVELRAPAVQEESMMAAQ